MCNVLHQKLSVSVAVSNPADSLKYIKTVTKIKHKEKYNFLAATTTPADDEFNLHIN